MSSIWDCAPLRELCDFHNGLWTGKKGPFQTAKIIRNTNFTPDGRIDLSDVATLQVETRHLAKRRLKKGDIIIEKSGGGPKQPVGRVVLFQLDAEDYSFSNFTSVIRVKHPNRLDSTYLHRVLYWWYLSGLTEPLQRRSTGIRNLDFDAYKSLEVPLPPLDEQERIVAVLDQAFASLDRARVNAEANLADIDSLLTRATAEIFTGVVEVGRLSAVSEVADHCLGKMLDRNKNTGELRPYLRNMNVRWFEIDQSDLLEMRIEDREVERYLVKKGDLLICEGGYPGRASIYDSDAPIFFQKALHRVRFRSSVMSKVLMYWLHLQDRTGALKDHFTGAGIQHFTGQALARFRMPVADEKVLVAAVARLDALHQSIADLSVGVRQKLAHITRLRKSLLQAAFSGQLT
ncbi:MAG TPA: restriction endonuclease subunit S [Xanthomonadaceae bacterium]|nr:restriction endonuclease subunit S [Xanthomonadaceae bacterium]